VAIAVVLVRLRGIETQDLARSWPPSTIIGRSEADQFQSNVVVRR
jgi:hypothetical protein